MHLKLINNVLYKLNIHQLRYFMYKQNKVYCIRWQKLVQNIFRIILEEFFFQNYTFLNTIYKMHCYSFWINAQITVSIFFSFSQDLLNIGHLVKWTIMSNTAIYRTSQHCLNAKTIHTTYSACQICTDFCTFP